MILRNCVLFFCVVILLSGCSWFANAQLESAASEPSSTMASAPSLPEPQPQAPALTVTLRPRVTASPIPAATATRIALPTPTPTLRPIAVSLLPLPVMAVAIPMSDTQSGLSINQQVATAQLAPTPDGVNRTVQAPILMYHYLSEPPADADIYRRDLSVNPDLFAAQLDAIQAAGYTTISLYQLLAYLTQGSPLPTKPVIITFDDGYRDNYVNALPILKNHGMKATFFIVSDFIDEKRPEYLTWDMVRALYAAGMSIEAHGRNHVSLRGKDKDYLVWQALGSAETIEHELGVRPRFICYPTGEYDQLTIDIFRSANYWAGITTIQGATHASQDMFELRRVRVRGTTTPEELTRLLGLDW